MDLEIQKNSLSPENNTSRTVKHINDCINYDNNIKEFFVAIGETEEVGYYVTNQTENVSAANMFSLNSSSPFPSIVKTHYMFSEEIAVCGILPDIQRNYYILDNKLFLWSTSNKSFDNKHVDQIMEEEKVIIAVSTIEKGRDQYFTKAVDALLAVATATYIKVYPIQNDIINPSVFYTTKIDFTPTCLCPGDWDQLFIGAADGQIYSLRFLATPGGIFNEQQIQESITITKLTAWTLKNVLISFFSFSVAPIYKICYDQTNNLLATIDNTQRIHIYSYTNDSLQSKYSYTPPKDTQFVAISSVPFSDSRHLRFVAFTSKGDRYFFGTSESLVGKLMKIALRGERKAPIELKDETVVDGFFQCGYTAFICKESIVGAQVINIDSENCYELVGKTRLNGFGICVSGIRHALSWLDAKLFHSPIVSQHFMDPIEFLIITSNGGCSVKFQPPCHFFRQQLINERFQYKDEANDLLARYSANDESLAMCLLLSSLFPQETDNYIYLASEYNRLQNLTLRAEDEVDPLQNQDQNVLSPDKLTPITHAFMIRTQRLIEFMWECPVFYKARDDLIKVSPQFSASYPDILKRLYQLIELSQRYLSKVDRNMSKPDDHQQDVLSVEKEQLLMLKTFLEELIETFKFIRILRKQKASLLTMAISKVSKTAAARLVEEAFGPPVYSGYSVITALREFAVSLITTFKTMIDTQSKDSLNQYLRDDLTDIDNLTSISPSPQNRTDLFNPDGKLTPFQAVAESVAADPWLRMESNLHLLTTEINEECPSFLKSPESLIIRAQLDLQAASRQPDVEEKKKLAHNAAKIFLTHTNIDFDIGRICCSFIALGFDVYAVKIASAHARFVDEAQRGYYWYVNGCNDQEFNSKRMFDEVSKIYESAFDASYSDEGLNAILETKDELFILLVYQHLLKTNEIEKLLNLDNELVLDFLNENAPKLVWKYYVAHNRYKEAIINLINYASDASSPIDNSDNDEITFDQRIRCLQLASNYARSEKLDDLAEESKIRIECAKIQKEMSPEKSGEPLKDISTLFVEAEKKYLWSFLLRLISIMKVDNFFKRDLDLKTTWANFLLCGDGSNVFLNDQPSENDINMKLKKLFSQIEDGKDALSPDYLVPVLEDYANYKNFRPVWAVETLTMLKIDGSMLYKAYVKLIESELPVDRMNQLIYAALWLLSHSFKGDIELIRERIKKVLENPKNPYYNEIRDLMNLFE